MIHVPKFKIFFALHCAALILLSLWIAHGPLPAQSSSSTLSKGVPLADNWPAGSPALAALLFKINTRTTSCITTPQTQVGGIGIVLIKPTLEDPDRAPTCPGSDSDPFSRLVEIPPVPLEQVFLGNGSIFIEGPQVQASIRLNGAYIQIRRTPEDVLSFYINENGRSTVDIQVLQ